MKELSIKEKAKRYDEANSAKTCKDEQKPADKIEHKFNVGDWVFIEEVKGYKNGPFQIKTVDSFGYSFDEYHTIPFMYEDLLSNWTIQDAKDGDVLAFDDETIVIFKDLYNSTTFHSYCHIEDGIFDVSKDWWEGEGIHLATKEQRDLLFQKMKENGYEWDAEKKLLKKIEQKPIPKYEIGDTIYYNSFGKIESMVVANVIDTGDGNPMYEDADGDAVFEKCVIGMKAPEENLGISSEEYNKIVDECIYGEQNPAWNEEDELYIRELESLVKQAWAIAEHENDKETIHKMSNLSFFLKTLKPQPKQEWSEEDEKMLHNIIKDVMILHNSKTIDGLKCKVNWLKSLKKIMKGE